MGRVLAQPVRADRLAQLPRQLLLVSVEVAWLLAIVMILSQWVLVHVHVPLDLGRVATPALRPFALGFLLFGTRALRPRWWNLLGRLA